ncbi:MAG: hypothetical protein H6R00_58 [Proteobacteria bacterium]|nr:hypothetical protein [Pseudomonadota bacterium]
MPFVFLYIVGCGLCGVMGRKTTFGFTGHFLLALFLTPLLDFLIQTVGRPSARALERMQSRKPD